MMFHQVLTEYVLELLMNNAPKGLTRIVFEELQFRKPFYIPETDSVNLHGMVQKGSKSFEISSGNKVLVTGRTKFDTRVTSDEKTTKFNPTEDSVHLTEENVYGEFEHRGHKYGGKYRSIKSVTIDQGVSVANARWTDNWATFVESMIQLYLFHEGETTQDAKTVSFIGKLDLSLPLLPTKPCDLKIEYDYSTRTLSAKGIEIMGVKTCRYEERTNGSFTCDAVEFVSLFGKNYEDLEDLISISLQISRNGFDNQYATTISLVEVETSTPTLQGTLLNAANNFKQLNVCVSKTKDPNKIIASNDKAVLAFLNGYINDQTAAFLSTSNRFLLCRTSKNILSYAAIVEVGQFRLKGTLYSLLRKASHISPLVVHVESQSLSSRDVINSSVSWVCQMNRAVADIGPNQKVFLLASTAPDEGIYNFVQDLHSKNLKFVFVLGENSSEGILQRIFSMDLSLCVLKDGVLGTYLLQKVTGKDVIPKPISNTQFEYLSPNLSDPTYGVSPNETCLGNIDYAGIAKSGKTVVGLAVLDLFTNGIVPDSELVWNVPDNWSMEDAVTVPHAYCIAYYALVERGEIKMGDTVLIHAGHTAVGTAAIAVALQYRCKVYTTVGNIAQRCFLKEHFGRISDENILSTKGLSFEPLFLNATRGHGADIVLNCLPKQQLQASVRCVAQNGKFVHIGKCDLTSNTRIGMKIFLRNTCFLTIDLGTIFELQRDQKRKLREMIAEGITAAVVRPLPRKVVEHSNSTEIFRKLSDTDTIGKIITAASGNGSFNLFSIDKKLKFICDRRNSYLIYGGSADVWTNITEWLVYRGARKIVIACCDPQNNHLSRRLNILRTEYDADILYTSTTIKTKEDALELLSEVYFLGPIGAVFLLADLTKDKKMVLHMDLALRTTAPKASLVNFLKNSSGYCYTRRAVGFTTFDIQCQKGVAFRDVLKALDNVLNSTSKDVLIRNGDVAEEHEGVMTPHKMLELLLPRSISTFAYEVLSQTADFERQNSLAAVNAKEVLPIFIIGGLSTVDAVRQLAARLYYPVYCARLPSNCTSLTTVAMMLAKKMKTIEPNGPYNIIAISWGGCLAIETTQILEEAEAKTNLCFLDAAPDVIQTALGHLNERPGFEVNLITKSLNISDKEVIQHLQDLTSWTSRLKYAKDHNPQCVMHDGPLMEAFPALKNYINELLAYRPKGKLIKSTVALLRPSGAAKSNPCGLDKYCQQAPKVSIVVGDHISIVKNEETAQIINREVIWH